MKTYEPHENVEPEDFEALLTREARARIPLWRQLFLYLHPFAFFRDASSGPAWMRQHALSYNRARRWMLLAYLRRWLVIAAGSFVGIAPAEALAADAPLFIIPAAGLGVGFGIAICVAACTAAAYLMLGARPSGS